MKTPWENRNGGKLKHLCSRATHLQWLQTKNTNTLLTKNHKLRTFNEKLQTFFRIFRDYMTHCLNENNQMMPDFLNRESFLYVFVEEEHELDQLLTKFEGEAQKEIMMACHYRIFIIPQEECMKFLPREITKNKEKPCICYLMFDNFIDKVKDCIHPQEIWCDQVLWHPLQLSNLSSYQEWNFMNSGSCQEWWFMGQAVFL